MNTSSRFVPRSLGTGRFLLGIVCAILICAVAPASAADDPVNITVLDPTPGQTLITYEFGSFSTETVMIEGDEYLVLSLGDENLSFENGRPALPRVCRSVVIPNASRVGVEVVASSHHDIEGVSIAPSKGILMRTVDPADVPYTFDVTYETDAWYPAGAAEHDEPYIMRDVRGMVVTVNPFQYNPVRNVLRVYDSVTVKVVEKEGPAAVNALPAAYQKPSRSFYQVQQSHFINFGTGRYPPLTEDGEMLIITHDAFNANIQPLAAWKNANGITTTVKDVSTIGNNSTAILGEIQSFYDTHNLSFVLLVGDGAQVQPPFVSGDAADPTYSLLAGSDHYPDVFVGRMSAETADQINTQVERTIEYEQMTHSEPWFWKGTGIASNQGPGHYGEYDDVHMGYIRDDLLAFGYTAVDELYDPYATSSQVSNAVNNGRGMINYCGHGSTTSWGTTGFSTTQVNALVNDNMLPVITSVACLNGNFYGTTCFAEAWLRATHNGEPTGAVGMYASTISQSWSPPMEAQDEFVDRYCDFSFDTYGALCFAGACKMMDVWGSAGRTEFDYWTVFGDPSLCLRGDGGGAMVLDIKVNGQDGPLYLPSSTQLNVTLSLQAGAQVGVPMDWWIYVQKNWTQSFWWKPWTTWTRSNIPIRSYNGALMDLNSVQIASAKVPAGQWDFHFVIDALNGIFEGTNEDIVEVQIY